MREKWVDSRILFCKEFGDFQTWFNVSLEQNHERLKLPITAIQKIMSLKEIKIF